MSFDPFTNDEVKAAASGYWDFTSPSDLRAYFQVPVICLLRLEKSIETWTKNMGTNGYFDFLEQTIGATVAGDLKMNYSFMVKS